MWPGNSKRIVYGAALALALLGPCAPVARAPDAAADAEGGQVDGHCPAPKTARKGR